MSRFDQAERIARLQLIRSQNVGPVTFRDLIRRFGTARSALEALPELAARGGRRSIKVASQGAARRELKDVAAKGIQALFLDDVDYPPALAATEGAPPILFVRGSVGLLTKPALAVVGARNASAHGIRFAERLARDVASEGIVIVSGLARGIDTGAHRGAKAASTIAVIAGGHDIYYPPENEAMQKEIATDGLLVSEQPLGTTPQARHFPRRNRIISGLSSAVLVVEAAERSGSLITARFAGEQGREVLAVPGSPLDPRAKGGNRLIKDGAHLVESTQDILDVLANLPQGAPGSAFESTSDPHKAPPLNDATPDAVDRQRIGELLSPTPVHIDEIIRLSGLSVPMVLTILLELELAGRLERHAGARVSAVLDPDAD
ncbi:MAG: DNA-processing protein DprA [Pseudomonadota bacterium]